MEPIKNLLIKTLQAFIEFCNKNNLKYFAAYGTALGAVRHKGFIPWDDDIDVHMPREDYNRLLELSHEIPAPYQLGNISECGYTAPFAKFMDMNTTIWEFERIPYIIGVYIDIFPLDDCPEDPSPVISLKNQLSDSFFRYFHGLEEWGLRDILLPLKYRNWTELKRICTIKYQSVFLRKHYHKEVLDLLQQLSSYRDCPFYFDSADVYGKWMTFNKECFEEAVEMPFENITIKVPCQYDEYLHTIYGDYMRFPPKEEQITHHSRKYINLNQGLTIDEVKQLMK